MADNGIENIPVPDEEKETVGEEKEKENEIEKKPERAPAPPRPPRPPVKYAPKHSAPPKKKKGRKLKIILIIVIVFLVSGFIFEELYFNYLGIRDIFIDAVVRLDPAYGAREKALDVRENELNEFQNELDAREKSIGFRESQNDRRSMELETREETVNDREKRVTPLYLRKMTEQEQLDMQSLGRSYALMPPEAAVEILMDLERTDYVAAILYNMSERNASAILAVMDPEYAAVITELLLG